MDSNPMVGIIVNSQVDIWVVYAFHNSNTFTDRN